MGFEIRGGKLGPRLLQDIISYNAQKLDHGPFDVLSQVPFHDASLDDIDPPLPDSSCRHHWVKKTGQNSITKDEGSQSGASTLRSFCLKCRCHLGVDVRYVGGDLGQRPCPTAERPLHHFIYKTLKEPSPQTSTQGRPGPWSARSFKCSAKGCGLSLIVSYNPPRLKHEWATLLTDKHMIRRRFEAAVAREPDKFQGHAPPTPGNVLDYLCRLINKALTETNIKPIPRDGKQFLLNLGEQCADLLEFLGFTSDGIVWQFPAIKTSVPPILNEPAQFLLDDVKQEISALMLLRPDDERRALKSTYSPVSGIQDLRLALGCETYQRRINGGAVDLEAPEHPCYAGLGAIADLHDNLVVFAYERQIAVDSVNLPYYLECLQTIAEGRVSEELGTKVAIEASDGRVSLKDVRDAYDYFRVGYHDSTLLDDTILGIFHARLSDSPKQETELRQCLRSIGQHRGSTRLQSAAANMVNNYEQALSFLDTSVDTPDAFIVSCCAVKVGARPTDELMARRAVALIANHRKSKALRQWLETGTLGDVEMDIGQAYARLNIQDRTTEDEMIITSYQVESQEQPSQVEELKRALATIAKTRNSSTLMSFAGVEDDEEKYSIAEWPVALNNIGNTCYLNSLLQFYFSIRPLRDLVLNIEKFKSSLDQDHIQNKKVGGRTVSRREVERAQSTAEELRKLFAALITTPSRSIRPDTELARLTLLTPKAEHARRQSIRQSSTQITRPVITLSSEQGPHVTEANQGHQIDRLDEMSKPRSSDTLGGAAEDKKGVDANLSNSSSETLIDGPVETDGTRSMAMETDSAPQLTPEVASHKEHQISPSSEVATDKHLRDDAQKTLSIDNHSEAIIPEHLQAPSQPPPIPPRPIMESKADDAVKEAEFAAQQQDVNEIAYNILNQLQCAIRPLSLDSEGEQLDQIKHLFYGKQMTYITSKSGKVRTKEEYMSDVRVSVPGGPTDIYAALDGAFDVEDVVVADAIEPKYSVINRLPPVLQIHIQRGQYDSENKKQFKSVAHIELLERIYMDRYMDTVDADILRLRQESWAWKRELGELKVRRDHLLNTEVGLTIPDAIKCASEYLHRLQAIEEEPKVDVPGTLIDELEIAANEAREDIANIESSIERLEGQISIQFKALQSIPYRLAAVFMHRGSTNAGHYWIYIFDFEQNLWRNYNDERVTVVKDVGEIFNPPAGDRPATPYFLVYVQDNIKDTLVSPVCRHVDVDAVQHADTLVDEYEQIDLEEQPSAFNGWDDNAAHGGGW